MSNANVLLEFITDELLLDPDEELTADDELLISEKIDSLGLMRLVVFIGEELGIKVPYDEILIENFRSVRVIDDYLAAKAATATS